MYNKKEAEGSVSLTLCANAFDGSTYIARVEQRPLGMENVVSDISKKPNAGLAPPVIIHASELIKEQILSYIREGRAVNILGIVTAYPAPKGTVPAANPQGGELPGLELRFRATREAEAAVSSAKASSYMVKTGEPNIRSVASLKDGSGGGILHRGYPARIAGENLKLVGEDAAVFLAPADSEGAPSGDEESWLKAADASYLPLNYPRTLEFFVPQEAESGRAYFVAVRTRYCRSGVPRKRPVTGFSARPLEVG